MIAGNKDRNRPFAGRSTQAKMGMMAIVINPNSGYWQGHNCQQQADQQKPNNFMNHGFSFVKKMLIWTKAATFHFSRRKKG